jgi:hypothetical protein
MGTRTCMFFLPIMLNVTAIIYENEPKYAKTNHQSPMQGS